MSAATALMPRPETRRKRIERLLCEVIRVGSRRQLRDAARVIDRLEHGGRITPTMVGVVECLWQQAVEHAADVRSLSGRPPPGAAWTWQWRHGYLLRDAVLRELWPGHPVTELILADEWHA